VDERLAELRRLTFHESRIPALDALEVFVAEGAERDEAVDELTRRTGFSRWFPVNGGHRVPILYKGGPYDPKRFTLREGAWDHEHCKRCATTIEPMALCWVSSTGDHTILCEECHRVVVASSGPDT
jgi:hypothetical protein